MPRKRRLKYSNGDSLTIETVSSICGPIFDDNKSLHPGLAWVGIFGSVSRGTQTDKSDVDLLFGYGTGTQVFAEAETSVIDMEDLLKKALRRKLDLFFFVEDGTMRLEILRDARVARRVITRLLLNARVPPGVHVAHDGHFAAVRDADAARVVGPVAVRAVLAVAVLAWQFVAPRSALKLRDEGRMKIGVRRGHGMMAQQELRAA